MFLQIAKHMSTWDASSDNNTHAKHKSTMLCPTFPFASFYWPHPTEMLLDDLSVFSLENFRHNWHKVTQHDRTVIQCDPPRSNETTMTTLVLWLHSASNEGKAAQRPQQDVISSATATFGSDDMAQLMNQNLNTSLEAENKLKGRP